jgi:AraC family transcriptional regulator
VLAIIELPSIKDEDLEADCIIQNILDIIENRITERINPQELARESGYSATHLGRLFMRVTGMTLMVYITRRKLQYALYDLGCGEKILDVAVKYGFETHAGFTKAFKKCFGYPPSLYRVHAIAGRPDRMEIAELQSIISGGNIMYPEIVEMQSFTVAGFTSRHKMPNVRFTRDIPVYWYTINMNYWDPLTRLHDTFNKSFHCEYTVCFNINSETGEFSYLLGVGVDNPEDRTRIEPDMYEMEMPGGLYARFTTPHENESQYPQVVRNIWKSIFDNWIPSSEYEFDETRYDFEYYYEDNTQPVKYREQMDIYIPIKKR